MTRRHHRLAAYTLSALLALTATACGNDDDDDPPTTTGATVAPTAPPTTQSTKAEIEAAFEDFKALLIDQATTPDPDDQRLDAVLADPLLTRIRESAAERKAANQVFEISPESRSVILSITERGNGTATAAVCTIGADRLIDRDSGEPVGAGGASTARDEVSFRLVDGSWFVSDYVTLEDWEGIQSCD